MKDLRGTTAFVTGASRGIGVKIAEALAHKGVNLILVARTESTLKRVAAELRACGVRIHVFPLDISARDNLETVVGEALSFTGTIDILVNNAATSGFRPYYSYSFEELERELFTNFVAPLLLVRGFLPYMVAQGRGHIVNISSLTSEVPLAYFAPYAAAKAGLAAFARSLRQELAGTGVSASVVIPGVVRDEGMIADFQTLTGFRSPRIAGGTTARRVAESVVHVIRRDLPEIVISKPPMRFLLAVLSLMPKTAERFYRAIGLQSALENAVSLDVSAQAERRVYK